MKSVIALVAALSLTTVAALAAPEKPAPGKSPADSAAAAADVFTPRAVKSTGTVTVEGHKIAYDAVAGRIIVHPQGWDDAAKPEGAKDAIGTAGGPPVASMFYVAYFKHGADLRTRPITFLYNGGPGSSTVWLHMGAFGPRACRHRATTPIRPPRLTIRSTTATASWMLTTWSSSTHRAPASAASRARTRRRRSRASIRTCRPSPTSSPSSSPSTTAGTHRSTSSARATARRARRS